jgi:hypothetical protein
LHGRKSSYGFLFLVFITITNNFKISIYENQNEIKYLTFFWDFFHPRRIDLDAATNLRFTDEELFNGYYSEVTCKNVKDKKLLYILKKIRNTKYIS